VGTEYVDASGSAMVRRELSCVRIAAFAVLMALLASASRAESASIRQLVEVVDFSGLSVSPDGRLVAFRTEQPSIERNTIQTVWYVQPVGGTSPPRRLADGGEPLLDTVGQPEGETAVWSPDGRWIYYRAMLDGRIDVWRAAVDASRTEPLTSDPANVRSFSLNADGSVLSYSVGAPREAVVHAEGTEHDRGIHVDRSVPLGDALFRSGYHEGRLATQRLLDNELERFPLMADAPPSWRSIDLSTGKRSESAAGDASSRTLSSSDLSSSLVGVRKVIEEREAGRIALLIDKGEARGRAISTLAVLRGRKDARPVECAHLSCAERPITEIAWRPGSDEVVFTVSDPDIVLRQAVFRWNVASGAVTPVVKLDGQIGGGGRWNPGACAVSSDALACVVAEPGVPPRLERVDLEDGQRKVLFEPNATLAQTMAESAPIERLAWSDPSGTRFVGRYYPPASSTVGPSPLFVVYYRCSGFLRGGVGDEWPLATLAAHGVAALCIDAAPDRSDAIERFEDGRVAIASAVDLLASRGEIDPHRIGVGGLSAGAEVALWTATQSRSVHAVSMATPVIAPSFYLLMSPWEDVFLSRLGRYWQLGAPDETPERWNRIAPPTDPRRLNAPVLMQLAEQEYRYALDYAVPWIRGNVADVYVFPHEKHLKFQPRHKLAVYERNLDWFRFWLQGVEDPDPLKAPQYARWRQMREHFPNQGAP